MSFVDVAYWVSTAYFVTLIVGYGSAFSWLFHNQQRSVITAGSAEPRVAKLILTGARGILIYEPDAKEQSDPKKPTKEKPREGLISELLRVLMDDPDKSGQGQIRLVTWDAIKDISLCPIVIHNAFAPVVIHNATRDKTNQLWLRCIRRSAAHDVVPDAAYQASAQ